MIKKEELLNQLNKAIELEDKLTPLFSRHIPASVSFSGLDAMDQKKTVDFFQQRAVTQAKHIEILKEIRASITAESQDVY